MHDIISENAYFMHMCLFLAVDVILRCDSIMSSRRWRLIASATYNMAYNRILVTKQEEVYKLAQLRTKRRHPISPKRKKRRLIIWTCFILILGGLLVLLIFGRNKDKEPKNTNRPDLAAVPSVEPSSEPTAEPTPEADRLIICIDPGHGYNDNGSDSSYLGDYSEKDINLPVALKVRDLLVEAGYEVIMTRDSDLTPEGADKDGDGYYSLSPQERAEFANEQKADYFFSIHCDSYPEDESVSGTRFYYYGNGSGDTYNWVSTIAQGFSDFTGADIKIIEKNDDNAYNVLKFARSTAGLVELGFITNRQEAEKLLNADYQRMLAEGLAKGIISYLTVNEVSQAGEADFEG
jgi:N-acetylmuramoyl-L-alanine amidase